jgi:hypothetical protein
LASAAVLLVGGGAIAAGVWAGGDHGFAVGLLGFYAVAGLIAYVWSGGSGDVAAIMRVGGDERQRTMDLRATAISGFALSAACVIGMIVDLARGGDGTPYVWLCAVAGVSYALALTWVKRRT